MVSNVFKSFIKINMPDAIVLVAMYFYFLYIKNIVKSDQIMKFFKMFTTWFGPELILKKKAFSRQKWAYCSIYMGL